MRRAVLIAQLVTAGFGLTPNAFADAQEASAPPPVPSDADAASARQLFDVGKEALRQGKFLAARDLFRRSLERVARPATAYNLAVSLRELGQAIEASTLLEQILAGRYGSLDEARRREAAAFLAEVDGELGRIVVEGRGAPTMTLEIDGTPAGTVAEGGRIERRVSAGHHVITLTAPGRALARRRVEVARGDRTRLLLEVTAKPEPAVLVLRSTNDTRLEIVGHGGAEGRLERQLPPGRYRVRATRRTHTRTLEVELTAGQRRDLELQAPSRSLTRSPWLWLGVGLAVAAATTVVLVRKEKAPVEDEVFGRTETYQR